MMASTPNLETDLRQDLGKLPDGWSWARLGDVCDAWNGRAFKSTEWRNSGVPIVRIQNLKDPSAAYNYFQGDLDERHRVQAGDLLFAWSGTPGTSFGAHLWHGPVAALNQHIFNIRFDRNRVDPKYFRYALNQNVTRYVAQAQGGVGLAHITKSKFMASYIPLAPLQHQKEIVAEIEKQFSRLDEAVANLKRVKANLKRYKAAVLKAAVEGKLTEEWRKQHPNVKPASDLLRRILAERLERREGKGKYTEPAALDSRALGRLPANWTWATVGQLSTLVQYGSSAKTSEKVNGIPVLRMGNIENGRLVLKELKYLPKCHAEFPALLLAKGDLLFNRTNSAELVGKTAVYRGTPTPCSFASYLIRVRLNENYNPGFLSYYINSVYGRSWIAQVISQQVGQANVNGTKLQALDVPFPPLAEQERIVTDVESRLSVIEELEAAAEADLNRAAGLRQSILGRAFSGRFALTSEYLRGDASGDLPIAAEGERIYRQG